MKRILVTVAAFLPALGAAQDFQEAPLLAPRTVLFPVTSQEVLASQDARLMLAPTALGPFNGYAPLLDDRRLFVATSWARRAILSGPEVPGLSLSPMTARRARSRGPTCRVRPSRPTTWIGSSIVGASPTLRARSRYASVTS